MPPFILPRTGILSFMDDDAREHLTSYGQIRDTTPDLVVIQEGQPQTSLYIVVNGSFPVTVGSADQEVHLDAIAPGDCFGEVAIFQPGPASATVTSEDVGQIWFMNVDQLQQFLLDWPHYGCALILGINTILSRRLKRANAVIKSNAIVPSFFSVRSKKRGVGVAA